MFCVEYRRIQDVSFHSQERRLVLFPRFNANLPVLTDKFEKNGKDRIDLSHGITFCALYRNGSGGRRGELEARLS